MDFGGFICAGFGAIVLLAACCVVAGMFYAKVPGRVQALKVVLVIGVLETLAAGYIYKVYFLDEALYIAASQGDAAKVSLLLGRGADPEALGDDGATAMQAATRAGNTQIVEMLRRAGAKQ